jgi:hypothetical protein
MAPNAVVSYSGCDLFTPTFRGGVVELAQGQLLSLESTLIGSTAAAPQDGLPSS